MALFQVRVVHGDFAVQQTYETGTGNFRVGHQTALARGPRRVFWGLGNRQLRNSVDELLAAFDSTGDTDFLKERDGGRDGHTVLVAAQTDEGPGATIGHYRLLQTIGEGGMNVVYMAEQEEPVFGGWR
jgi:hypothetical protein